MLKRNQAQCFKCVASVKLFICRKRHFWRIAQAEIILSEQRNQPARPLTSRPKGNQAMRRALYPGARRGAECGESRWQRSCIEASAIAGGVCKSIKKDMVMGNMRRLQCRERKRRQSAIESRSQKHSFRGLFEKLYTYESINAQKREGAGSARHHVEKINQASIRKRRE